MARSVPLPRSHDPTSWDSRSMCRIGLHHGGPVRFLRDPRSPPIRICTLLGAHHLRGVLTFLNIATWFCVPGNGARNACQHSLAKSLETGVLSPCPVTAPRNAHSRGITLRLQKESTSARIYRCSILPGE